MASGRPFHSDSDRKSEQLFGRNALSAVTKTETMRLTCVLGGGGRGLQAAARIDAHRFDQGLGRALVVLSAGDYRHCEEQSDEAIQGGCEATGLLRSARNDAATRRSHSCGAPARAADAGDR